MKRITRVGIIGAGGISEAHAQGYLTIPRKAKIVAVADVVKRRARQKAKKWRAESCYSDFEDLLDRDDVEAVSVCTPTYTHAGISIATMKAGKHVLCEKPMAMDLKEADDMIRTCQEENVILQIGHHNRFDPIFERSKEIIEKGLIGRICLVKARQAHGWGWARGKPRSWFTEPEKSGGGTLLDNGCHLFDLLRWLVGEVDASWSYRGDIFENYVKIFGSEGTVIADSASRKLLVYSRFLKPKKLSGWISPFIPPSNAHAREVQDFVSCITRRKKPRVSGEDGRKSLELALAAYASSRIGEVIKLPLTC